MKTALGQKTVKPAPASGTGMADIVEDIHECCILIADEDEQNCNVIAAVLREDGFQNLHFGAGEAKVLRQAQGLLPDMLILGGTKLQSGHLEVCRALRRQGMFDATPIIIQLPQNGPDDRARMFDAGVTDILPQPVTASEVRNRVNLHLKFHTMVRGLSQYHRRLARDLEMARTMQYGLLPEEETLQRIARRHKIDIAHRYETSDELGGDFWGVEILDQSRILVYVADFAGHGVSAALNTFRLHSLISQYDDFVSPAAYLEKLNRILFRLLPVEQFATMLCGIIDVERDRFTYAAAASPAPLLSAADAGDLSLLDPSGLPLGMVADAGYENREIPFGKGDMLFLYSDVLTESADQLGRMIGEEKFLEMCRDTGMNISRQQNFLDRFMRLFNMHVARPLQDDLTAVTLTRR